MKGVVACGNVSTARAGVEILRAGGNAFDAAVGAALAAGIAEAGLTGLAGGGYAIVYRARDSLLRVYDFFVSAPGLGLSGFPERPDFRRITLRFTSSTQDFFIGAASVAVPGTPLGLRRLKEDLGRLPWPRVVGPAVSLAREGVEVDPLQASCFRILEPIFRQDPGAEALYYPRGCPPQPGERIRNPALADFLEDFPRAVEDLYTGTLGRNLSSWLRQRGGLLTPEDLGYYRVYIRRPLRYVSRRGILFTNPPPSFGGSLVALGWKYFEEHFSGGEYLSREHLETLARALVRQDNLREQILLHPEEVYLRLGASAGTTHLSVADEEGNLCGITLTFGEGAGLFFPEAGLVLNNILGEEDLHPRGFFSYPPGRRIPSMMAPSILQVGGSRWVLGSGGSKRIRSALLQVLLHLSFFGLSSEAAVEAPRLHFEEGVFQAEPGFPEGLKEWVRPVNLWPGKDLYFGGVHLVRDDLTGAGDPRRAGVVLYA